MLSELDAEQNSRQNANYSFIIRHRSCPALGEMYSGTLELRKNPEF